MDGMDLDGFRWLLTDAGTDALGRAAIAYADSDGDPMRATSALRRDVTDPEHAAAAMTQVELRVKAVDKFGADALVMFFTPDGLEQATRSRVAAHRAGRLSAAQPSSVIDLGCGIGGDLVAFARAGLTAAGVDLDPVRVAVAEANLAALGLPGAVGVADATTLDLDGFGAVFADPARRTGRGRSFRVDEWTPPWSFLTSLFRRPGVVKVAPGLPHELIPVEVEAEWVSDHGAVKEAALWTGPLAVCRRRATVLGDGGLATLTDEDDPDDFLGGGAPPVREIGGYLYEPDGAVIRAGLVSAVAAGVHGGLVDPHIAYVTSDESFQTPFARGYRVVEELPFREKQLRAALHARGIGALTIKKRGVEIVPEQLRKRLALRGDDHATVVLTRMAGVGRAFLVVPF